MSACSTGNAGFEPQHDAETWADKVAKLSADESVAGKFQGGDFA